MEYSHLFGPVRSRRLGCSLGIDLVPCSICTYNCVYCECGTTNTMTAGRQEFFPVQEVCNELDDYLSRSPSLDYATFSGSGEPTLSLSIGTVIRFLKDRYPEYRVAVLTNGSLLDDPGVRHDLVRADVVLPTVSSVQEETFRAIHRPSPGGISLKKILNGLMLFRKEYTGEIWLEVFIVPGLNTSDVELTGLRTILAGVHPDRVQLNTLDRPGTEDWVRQADAAEMERVQKKLDYPGVEQIAPQHSGAGTSLCRKDTELHREGSPRHHA